MRDVLFPYISQVKVNYTMCKSIIQGVIYRAHIYITTVMDITRMYFLLYKLIRRKLLKPAHCLSDLFVYPTGCSQKV
jgi:hypothetical protein